MKSITKLAGAVAVLYAVLMPVVSAETRAEARAFKDAKVLTIEELEANPAGFLGQEIAFDAFYAQMGDVYRPFYTPFIREFFVNFWVWSPSSRLWEPKEREAAFFFCYVERANAAALKTIQNLKRFDAIKVLARVEIVSNDHAWLKVTTVVPTDMPTYSDKAIKHIELGMRRLDLKDYVLAGQFFEIAMKERLPREAKKLVYRQAGVTFFELKQYAKAEDALSKAIELVTASDPLLNLRLGQSLLHIAEGLAPGDDRKAKLAVAAQQLEAAISLEPNLVDAHAAVGLVYGLLGDYTKGLNSCRIALKLSPQHAQAFRNQAVIYHLKGDTDNAVLYYQKAILAKANEPTYHRELADVYMELKRHADAETEYRNFVTLDPENPEAYWLRAQSRLAQNNVDGAIEDDKAALDKQADFYRGYKSLAEAYVQKKDFQAARETLDRGAAVFPQDLQLRLVLADVLKVQGKFDEAAKALAEAVKINPADTKIRFEWAKILAEKPNPETENAIKELETVVKADPEMMEARFLLGRLYVDTAQPQKAMANITKFLSKNPKDVQALTFQGAALTQLGQLPKAIQSYDEVLAIDSTNPYASNNKAGVLCLMSKDVDVALKLSEAAVASHPSNMVFLDTLSWAKSLNGKYDEAKSIAVKVLNSGETVEVLYHLAVAENGLGDIDSAAEHVAKAKTLSKERKDVTADFKQLVAKINGLDAEVKKALKDRERNLSETRRNETRDARRAPTTNTAVPVPTVTPK
jgi:tetratricopeptide (TPR) repeat protein